MSLGADADVNAGRVPVWFRGLGVWECDRKTGRAEYKMFKMPFCTLILGDIKESPLEENMVPLPETM